MLKLAVIGSGDAFCGAGRGHSAYWVSLQKAAFMVDFGATALMNLKRQGRRASALDRILLTHLHGDHIGGLPFLIIDGMFSDRRDTPLHIVGPLGTEATVSALLDCVYPQILESPFAIDLVFEEIQAGDRLPFLGGQLSAFAADHQDPPALGLCYRFVDADGHSLGFSGDTRLCPGLWQAIDAVDLAVVEMSSMRPPAGAHATFEEWIAVREQITAKRLLFSHLSDEVRAQADLSAFAGRAKLAEDGEAIALGAANGF